jgi:hypothetical protein
VHRGDDPTTFIVPKVMNIWIPKGLSGPAHRNTFTFTFINTPPEEERSNTNYSSTCKYTTRRRVFKYKLLINM